MASDESLFNGLKARDPEAFEWLVNRFEGQLFRYFICEHRDYHRAEEQVAETLLEFTKSVHTIQGNFEQLAGFVFGIARNIRMRHWRHQRANKTIDQQRVDVELLVDSHLSSASQLESRDQIDQILGLIGQFQDQMRDVLLFRFVEGYSLQQISELLNMPLGSVKSHIHRGITKLREILSHTDCHHE